MPTRCLKSLAFLLYVFLSLCPVTNAAKKTKGKGKDSTNAVSPEVAVAAARAAALSAPKTPGEYSYLFRGDPPKHSSTSSGHFSDPLKSNCKYDFKVYVYPLDYLLTPIVHSEEARANNTYHVCKKCIFEQFALEYVILDFFTQFCGRTYDPEDADFFYLPVIKDIDYRIGLHNHYPHARQPSPIETVLLEAIEKGNTEPWKAYLNVTDKYWLRHQGADHIIVMAAPVTNLRHESNMRGFFHYVSD